MALTYEESATLMRDQTFVGRVKVAILHYANYIYDEASGTVGHTSRVRWAQSVTANPDLMALSTTPLVVMDDAVQTDGAGITDAALQSATETAVNKTV